MGFIDKFGNLKIDFLFRKSSFFKNGFAMIDISTKFLGLIKWGKLNYLSKEGNWLLINPVSLEAHLMKIQQ